MRKSELDIIRVLALLLVILQHSTSMLDISNSVYNCLWMGVPLFVMLSGALQLKPFVPGDSVWKFYAKRYKRILPPFVLWALVVYIISIVPHKYESVQSIGEAIKCFIPYLVTNRINVAYWFVFLIAALYLVTPLLKVVFGTKHGARILPGCIAVWLVATVLRDFFPSWPVFKALPVTGRFAGYYLGYYLCGYYLLSITKCKPKTSLALSVFMLSLAANIILKGRGITSLSLQAIQSVSLFAALAALKVSPKSSFLTDMSRYSYTAYLTHFVVIALLYKVLPTVFPQRWFTPVYTALTVLAAEYIFCRVLECIKFLPGWLTGIARK